MSHLSRRYTNFFYVEDGRKLKRVFYLKRGEFLSRFPLSNLPGPNGIFPCDHEKRDFLSKKGKKHNTTHARMKRKHKARTKTRRAA